MVDFEFDELKREFLAEADEKVREMKTVAGSDPSPEALERLAYLAHQLKGAGGSYGYQAISTEAAELERAVESVGAEGTSTDLETVIRERMANLETEIARRLAELDRASA
ncbi:MAG: Hpt domain-containing protein [Thermoanaerobaculia bacterium]